MRDIKFRAWNKTLERMQPFEEIEIYETGYLWQALRTNIDTILMQYTGLLDKNGVEIFEGDIVKDDYDNWVVVFEGGKFQAKRTDKDAPWNYFLCDIDTRLEIIGNIYEHPTLLN